MLPPPLRRRDKADTETAAWDCFSRAAHVHLSGVGPDGRVVLRVLHGVVHDGALVFHGATRGEKTGLVGQAVVASAVESVAEIPSHWTHPERACPATTLFRSAQLHGVLEEVLDPDRKAAALQALMVRFQPGGGHRPIRAEDPLYAGALRGVAVWRLPPGTLVAKSGLAQQKPERWRQRALDKLWERGDVAAVRVLGPVWDLAPWPAAPAGARLVLPAPEAAPEVLPLLRERYWTVRESEDDLVAVHAGSQAWMGVRAPDGTLVATARAVSDGRRLAHLMDVAVRDDWQGRGIGRALVMALLDHPRVRRCRRVTLRTRDAGPFYAGMGWVPRETGRLPTAWERPGSTCGA